MAAAVFMATFLFVAALKIGKVKSVPPLWHKVEHFLYYGAMTVLVAVAYGRRYVWLAPLTISIVGALDEWHQYYIPNRNSSVYDWMVDTVGALLAIYVYVKIMEKRRNAIAPGASPN